MKQWLHDFLSHPWVDCKEAADGADGRAECENGGSAVGAEPLPLSKIRDGSAERNERPRGAAVFDFRFRARYEPQLLLQSVYATRPDPVVTLSSNSSTFVDMPQQKRVWAIDDYVVSCRGGSRQLPSAYISRYTFRYMPVFSA